ncbi:MAG TPA: 50S ribosomal protein L9 [Planctomycetota bacterium]|nr:50S ribosomal protein L9 [Planctomycetota bacterium]
MDVILIRDVDKLGKRGARVAVKPGFARNFLLPFGHAVLPTADNIRRTESQKKKWLAEDAKLVEAARGLADMLKDVTLSFLEKASDEGRLYGSVNDKLVAAKLAEKGYKIDPRTVRLDAPIREIGDYQVRLRFHSDVELRMPVRVRAEGFENWEPGMPMQRQAQVDAPKA